MLINQVSWWRFGITIKWSIENVTHGWSIWSWTNMAFLISKWWIENWHNSYKPQYRSKYFEIPCYKVSIAIIIWHTRCMYAWINFDKEMHSSLKMCMLWKWFVHISKFLRWHNFCKKTSMWIFSKICSFRRGHSVQNCSTNNFNVHE